MNNLIFKGIGFSKELLYETLVDKLFNLFEKPLDRPDFKIGQLSQFINDNLKNEDRNISINLIDDNNINVPQGFINSEYDERNNESKHEISIRIPPTYDTDIRIVKLTFDTILHELTHIITNRKIPILIRDKKVRNSTNYINTLNIKIADLSIYTLDEESSKAFLDYIFHVRERANFAFTITYALRNDLKSKKINFQKLLDLNDDYINKYFNGDTTSFSNWSNLLKHSDTYTLLEIQLAVKYLNSKVYYNKLKSFKKLCIKYERRLIKLLGNTYGI